MPGKIFYPGTSSEIRAAVAYELRQQGGAIEEFRTNPLFFEMEEGSVNAVRDLIFTLQAASDKRVVLLPKAETLTVEAQNTILKVLEDREDVFFIFSSTKRLLKTIESRCTIEESRPLPRAAFLKKAREVGLPETAQWLYAFCEGNEDTLNDLAKEKGLVKLVEEFWETSLEDKGKLLMLFGVAKEKDKNSFVSLYKEWLPNLLKAMLEKALKEQKSDMITSLDVINSHLKNVRISSSYSANDFLELLMLV